jgi:hypothetical protein
MASTVEMVATTKGWLRELSGPLRELNADSAASKLPAPESVRVLGIQEALMKGVDNLFRAAVTLPLVFTALILTAGCSASGSATAAPAAPAVGVVAGPADQNGGSPPDGELGKGATSQQPGASPAPDTQLIVYNGTLDLQVDAVSPVVDKADQLVAGLGGHIASSNTASKDDQDYATVTYRIPADKWDEALAELQTVGTKVLNQSTTSQDVTGQVVDLDARIANAQASETALQAIMDKATTIDDVLKVQSQLTTVRGDIESMEGQRDLLANRAALATLEVDFETVVTQTQTAKGGWDFGQVVDDALATLVRVGQGLVTLGVWLLIVVVPIAVPLLVILAIALYLRRRQARRQIGSNIAAPPTGASAV